MTDNLINVEMKWIKYIIDLEFNMINMFVDQLYKRSLEGIELSYEILLLILKRYLYAEKCLAFGVIDTALDLYPQSIDLFNSVKNNFSKEIKNIFDNFTMKNDQRLPKMKDIEIPLGSGNNNINGQYFNQWWMEQEDLFKKEFDPLNLLKNQLPKIPLEIIKKEKPMFYDTIPEEIADLKFCNKINWDVMNYGIKQIISYTTIVLIVCILSFCFYLLGNVIFEYWRLSRELKYENRYNISLILNCGLFHRGILWKHFIIYSPSCQTLLIGIVGLIIYIIFYHYLRFQRESWLNMAIINVNQTLHNELKPIEQLSNQVWSNWSDSYDHIKNQGEKGVMHFQNILLNWTNLFYQSQNNLGEKLRADVTSNNMSPISSLTRNIVSTSKCLIGFLDSPVNLARKLCYLDIKFPSLPSEIPLIPVDILISHLNLLFENFLNHVFNIYLEKLRKKLLFYIVVILIGISVPMMGIAIYLFLVFRKWIGKDDILL
jgi:hypothetical protein